MSKVTDTDIEKLLAKPKNKEIDLRSNSNPAEKYNKLTDYYYDAIYHYGYMISRTLPDQFRGADDIQTELASCKAGVVAFKACIEILRKQIQGTKPLILMTERDEYETLEKYYEDTFIQYIGDLSLDIPEKFRKTTTRATELRSCKAAIKAFEKAVVSLVKQVEAG